MKTQSTVNMKLLLSPLSQMLWVCRSRHSTWNFSRALPGMRCVFDSRSLAEAIVRRLPDKLFENVLERITT
jgi:hypothetical protein